MPGAGRTASKCCLTMGPEIYIESQDAGPLPRASTPRSQNQLAADSEPDLDREPIPGGHHVVHPDL